MPPRTDEPALRDVWIVNHYAGPARRGDGTRHHDLARELCRRGYAVTIFASSFDHAGGTHERVGRTRLHRAEEVDGVRYVWIRCGSYRGNSVRRILNMLEFSILAVLVQARFPRPGFVIGSTVHPLAAVAGYVTARLRRARFFFEVRDLWPQTLIDMGALSEGSTATRALRAIEAFLVRHGDGVITLLPGMGDYLAERGLNPRRLLYLPNGADLGAARGAAPPASALPACLAAWRDEGAWVCAYLGAHGRANALDVVLRAAAILQRDPGSRIRLLLVGDGPQKPGLMDQAASLGLTNICFANPVPKRDVPAMLGAVDAGLVHVLKTPIYRYGMSFNKLFDYMASGRPVVFACDTAHDPVAESRAGVSVAPEDPVALATALRQMSHLSAGELRAMGERGREYVRQHHDTAGLGDRLADFLESRPQEGPAA